MIGRSKDILEYTRKGIYDAIMVGRRGLSRIQKTFMGSTSAELLESAEVTPVWMVDGKVASQRILVAVDGSESSYRALDHVGFMLSENPVGKFFDDAAQKLKDAGIAADRVEIITTKRRAKVGKMILAEAKKGNYGTVVVGRRGADQSHFFGSVSRYVTERITDSALWFVAYNWRQP